MAASSWGAAAPCASGEGGAGSGLAPCSPSPRAQPRAGGRQLCVIGALSSRREGGGSFFFGLASTLRTSLCSAAPSEGSGALTPSPPGRARAAARSAAPPSPPSPGGCCRRDAWAAAGGEEKTLEPGPTHPTAPPRRCQHLPGGFRGRPGPPPGGGCRCRSAGRWPARSGSSRCGKNPGT